MTCLGAIVIILLAINEKALSYWTLPIQPNSLISIFAVITKASLVFPMAECISQQKWILFNGGRPNSLIRLEQFDSASRGPFGSFVLLWHVRLESLPGSILAFLTILALAIDPFAQQVIHISDRTISDDRASASTYLARSYDSGLSHTGFLSAQLIRPRMQGAILMGIYGRPMDWPYTCSTGNCTYPDISTLGVCGSCQNVTAQSNISIKTDTGTRAFWTNVTTPGGFNLSSSLGISDRFFRWMTRLMSSTDSQKPGLVNFATWKRPQTNAWQHNGTVHECRLDFCERTYAGFNITNGTPATPTVSEKALRMNGQQDDAYYQFYEPIRTNSGTGLVYNISINDVTVISKTLKALFTVTQNPEDPDSQDEEAAEGFDISGALYHEDLSHLVGLVAESMTSYIRDADSTKILVTGTAFHREAYIAVRWLWISLPAALVALGATMLLWTIQLNKVRSGPVWKSSSLPGILYARAGDRTSSDVQDLEKLSGMSDEAERTQMQLVRNEAGTLRLNVRGSDD